ncbi:adenylosuccinate synthase [Spiroplasma platyhelix]|uniref:Adenylosuccinate synthetase n=1 Tax=Spiroplasma platyhelix PALS-1 TaxID=1276218 RepID=A0A846U0J5_9MOLU|nr:adenylosuccinate synthase [Spiroplasma platyhelix]MBE4704171.1 Adenylosuccinate synthetase [Spiroplasma platyhelix PALS-1]NKE38544.1 adenylosuccinate synthase [Spiroplasma platyhelix PALS-1]UJB29429.1 adenylosuccinate synthetase [Spiroplasma platyhelix PALS-1]
MLETKYQTTAVIGSQWGDEGKGKITDYFAQNADVIVRWSGGDNAGHTIVFDNKKFKLSIIPSGIFNQKVTCVIANGCVVNLEKLVSEINYLKENGYSCENLKISDRAHIIFPYHSALDECQELARKEQAIGTTKKGIGPCYADKMNRVGIRIGDLLDKEEFVKKLTFNVEHKNKILKLVYNCQETFDVTKITDRIFNELLPQFQNYITDTRVLLDEKVKANQIVLFEGAQGSLLDLDHGTYPFVTSSHPIASSIATGTGLCLKAVTNIIGITKAYNTRVGEGVFPTEFEDEIARTIREVGNEYGTVSKRPRRIGWFDAVILKYSAEINGFTGLAIMLLDVLSGIKELKICTSYLLNNQEIKYVPSQIKNFAQCQPQFITMPGWTEDITKVTSFDQLPINAQNYLKKISELVGVPITMFSVGPNRTQTILVQ